MSVAPVQLVFEDEYCATLQELIVALCGDRLNEQAPDEGLPVELPPAMTAAGDRNFANVLGPALGRPLAETKNQPQLVVAVADADRPRNLVPIFPDAPGGAGDDGWVERLDEALAAMPDDAALAMRRSSWLERVRSLSLV